MWLNCRILLQPLINDYLVMKIFAIGLKPHEDLRQSLKNFVKHIFTSFEALIQAIYRHWLQI